MGEAGNLPSVAVSSVRPRPFPPEWATGWGVDRSGLFAELAVGEVAHRLRWIPPGRFRMGSPEDEAGRFDDETPHWVTLTRGFWLGETACTQALWEAVMGENPSRFRSSGRPVEQVSWEDCQRFFERLAEELGGERFRLPTEAEWEYACRAGTETATYAGDLDLKGENNAPVLDAIAWYGGNSGVDFELENGWDSSGWPEKQYDHKRAGTHPVGGKEANAWGLHDMLGNVWEWCQDWHGGYPAGEADDPRGPAEGSDRVFRGGGWRVSARNVRAASRLGLVPGIRDGNLGFRLARGQ